MPMPFVQDDLSWKQRISKELQLSYVKPTECTLNGAFCGRKLSTPPITASRHRPSRKGSHAPSSAGSSTRASSASSSSLQRGDRVSIQGMRHRYELNGSQGCVIKSSPDPSGRVLVELGNDNHRHGAPGGPKVMSILASRLQQQQDIDDGSMASAITASAFTSEGLPARLHHGGRQLPRPRSTGAIRSLRH